MYPNLSLLSLFTLALAVTQTCNGYHVSFPKGFIGNGGVADKQGQFFVCGYTWNEFSPEGTTVRLGNHSDRDQNAALFKLSRTGQLLSTVVFGGTGYEVATKVTVDAKGNVILLGYSSSTNFPGTTGIPAELTGTRVFVSKFDNSGTNLLFSTILSEGDVWPAALTVDAAGNIYVTGSGSPTNIPTILPQSPAYPYGQAIVVAKLTSAGQPIFIRRFGGTSYDQPTAIAADASGNIYIAGTAMSFDFPIVNPVDPWHVGSGNDAFVTKISPDGESLLYSTRLGGNCGDAATALAVNAAGEAFVTGTTCSSVFPELGEDPDYPLYQIPQKVFVAKIASAGASLVYTQVLDFGAQVAMNTMALTSSDTVIIGGSIGQEWFGLPFVMAVDANGIRSELSFARACTGDRFNVQSLSVDARDKIYLTGAEQTRAGAWNSFAAALTPASLVAAPAPRLAIISPSPNSILAKGKEVTLVAALRGFSNDVKEVRFYDGRRFIGATTNANPVVGWSNASRGLHFIRAVAVAGTQTVTSCPVRISVKSIPNDDMEGAIYVAGERVHIRGNTRGATVSLSRGFELVDVWYAWTAPRDGVYRVSLLNSNTALRIMILTNSAPPQPFQYLSEYPQAFHNLRAESGKTYYISVGGNGFSAPFKLGIERITPPPNDDFANRIQLSGAPVSVTGTLENASLERSDPLANYSYASVWYSWIAPAAGVFVASVTALNSPISLQVSRGDSPTNGSDPVLWHPIAQTIPISVEAGERINFGVFGQSFYYLGAAAKEFTLTVIPTNGPVNDHFANRITLTGSVVSVTGSTLGATRETNEPQHSFFGGGSVWWSWTAPTSGIYAVHAVAGSSYSQRALAIYVGDSLSELSRVNDGDYPDLVFQTDAGQTYQIAVADSGASSLVLSIEPVTPPINDNFADALPLTGSFISIYGTTLYSTIETNEFHGGFGENVSVWYRWTAPSNGVFAIGQNYSSYYLFVYEGTELPNLLQRASGSGRVIFAAQGGVEYHIAIVATYSSGSFAFSLRPVATPPNDNFANRITLSGTNVFFGGNGRNATAETPEFHGAKSLWWSWTAPADGVVVMISPVYGHFSIFTGDPETNLFLAANSYEKRLSFIANAGTTYSIGVDTASYGSDEAQLHLFYPDVPANDHFMNAAPILTSTFATTNSNVGATAEPDEPFHASLHSPAKSLWWRWTPPADESVLISTEGSEFLTVLAVYSGATLGELHEIVSSGSGAADYRAAFALRVRAGETYYIAVDGYYVNEFGTVRLRITQIPTPANDDFASRAELATNHVTGSISGASRELDELSGRHGINDISLWWNWTAPTSGVFVAEIDRDFAFQILSGTALTNLQSLWPPTLFEQGNWYPPTPDRYAFEVVAGSNYALRVSAAPAMLGEFTLALTYVPPPPNDYFTNRLVLAGTGITLQSSNTFASSEPYEPYRDSARWNSVWFEWTAPDTRPYAITTTGLVNHLITVYTGSALSNLVAVPTPGYESGFDHLLFRAAAGRTYFIAVTEYSSPRPPRVVPNTTFTFRLPPAMSPANDDFANRTVLHGSNIVVSGSNVDATTEDGEPPIGFATHQSVWWSWTPLVSGGATVRVLATNAQFAGAVFTGDSVSNLTIVATNFFHQLPLTFSAEAGQSYAIAIDGNSSFAAPFVLVIEGPASDADAAAKSRQLLQLRLPEERQTVIESSTNLLDWTPFHTNRMEEMEFLFTPRPNEAQRFFRVR